MNEWTRLSDLRPGAIFVTRTGILAVKSEYHSSSGHCECILLASGEYAGFDKGGLDPAKHNATEVREIALNLIDDERAACAAECAAEAEQAAGDAAYECAARACEARILARSNA